MHGDLGMARATTQTGGEMILYLIGATDTEGRAAAQRTAADIWRRGHAAVGACLCELPENWRDWVEGDWHVASGADALLLVDGYERDQGAREVLAHARGLRLPIVTPDTLPDPDALDVERACDALDARADAGAAFRAEYRDLMTG